MATSFENKVQILAEIFDMEEPTPAWQEFIQFHNLGLPYAYGIRRNFFPAGEEVTALIEKSFASLLTALEIKDDIGFESLDEMVGD